MNSLLRIIFGVKWVERLDYGLVEGFCILVRMSNWMLFRGFWVHLIYFYETTRLLFSTGNGLAGL